MMQSGWLMLVRVIPGRPKAEPGTQGPHALRSTIPWVPGSRFASPGMTNLNAVSANG
jgi:hypothetical protein